MMKVLIDNGHGENTSGKRSPDGRLREYAWAREVANILRTMLVCDGIDAECITPELTDVPIRDRCKRANNQCAIHGASNCVLISIHINAAPEGIPSTFVAKDRYGTWKTPQGWQVCVGRTASAKSKKLASLLTDAANSAGVHVRVPSPTQSWWVQNLGICQGVACPAVLVENFFMDNAADCAFLMSDSGKLKCAKIMANGIRAFILS